MNKSSRMVTVTLATVLGAGAAIAATASQAQATSVWDRVAACESGNNWSINTGNGFYGGLQFTHSTWIAYGGGAYAANANGATAAEQIAIAQKVLASQGAGAWPVCSVRAGLTSSNGGSSSTASSSTSTTTTTSSTTIATTSSATTPTPTTDRTLATRTVTAAPSRTWHATTTMAPRMMAPRAWASTTTSTLEGRSLQSGVAVRGTYRVQSGDTLSTIALAHGLSWQQLWAKNRTAIANPNLIYVGQLLKL